MGGTTGHSRTLGFAAGVALAALCAMGGVARADGPAIGVVKVVEGGVALLRPDTRQDAVVGAEVRLNDRLRTGPDGAVGVTLNDGTLVSLGPNSLFEFTEYQYVPQDHAFGFLGSLLGGTLLYASGKIGKLAPERTRVQTPISIVSVRGTRFGLRLPPMQD